MLILEYYTRLLMYCNNYEFKFKDDFPKQKNIINFLNKISENQNFDQLQYKFTPKMLPE
jgi:hypothetical protein